MKTTIKDGIIQTNNLSKNYGKVKAVKEISLNVDKGEIYGFLGLNGAGKTTTIRMLLGMIKPTTGESYLKGEIIHAGCHELWNSVGIWWKYPTHTPN